MKKYEFEMDEADILKEYREAKSPSKQIKILAEQNLVPPKVMREFIVSRLGKKAKVSEKKSKVVFWTPERIESLRRMAASGMYDKDIAERLGVSLCSVKGTRYEHGIPCGRYDARNRGKEKRV